MAYEPIALLAFLSLLSLSSSAVREVIGIVLGAVLSAALWMLRAVIWIALAVAIIAGIVAIGPVWLIAILLFLLLLK